MKKSMTCKQHWTKRMRKLQSRKKILKIWEKIKNKMKRFKEQKEKYWYANRNINKSP